MSGGLWVTKGCHDFDFFCWLTRALPKSVSASASLSYYTPKPEAALYCRDCPIEGRCPDSHLRFRVDNSDFPPLRRIIEEAREASGAPADLCLYNADKDTFDNGAALITFANGVKASFTLNVVAPFTDHHYRISGTEGTLDGSYETPAVRYWKRHDGEAFDRAAQLPVHESAVITQDMHGGADNLLLNEFLGFIRGRTSHLPTPAEAAVPIAIAVAATLAGDEERTVHLRELAGWGELCGYLQDAGLFAG